LEEAACELKGALERTKVALERAQQEAQSERRRNNEFQHQSTQADLHFGATNSENDKEQSCEGPDENEEAKKRDLVLQVEKQIYDMELALERLQLAMEERNRYASSLEHQLSQKDLEIGILKAQLSQTTQDLEKSQEENNEVLKTLELVRANQCELILHKQTLESEVEDLSQSLFEVANGMVASEAAKRAQVEDSERGVQIELRKIQSELADERDQTRELKQILSDLNEELALEHTKVNQLEQRLSEAITAPVPIPKTSPSHGASRSENGPSNSLYLDSVHGSRCSSAISLGLSETQEMDSMALDDLMQFISQAGRCGSTSQLMSLPYLHQVIAQDVIPCLSFPAAPRSLAANKLVNAIFASIVSVDAARTHSRKDSGLGCSDGEDQDPVSSFHSRSASNFFAQFLGASLSPSKSGGSKSHQCCLCERAHASLPPYVLRVGNLLSDEHAMCQWCRDRIVTACDFIAFAQHIRSNLYRGKPAPGMYLEMLRLRTRMFYARVGQLVDPPGVY
jgi:hypothetical protein